MSYFGFFILLCLICLLSCEGKVSAPSAGSTLTFARNSAESRIVWSFDDTLTPTTRRDWSFIPPGQRPVVLAIANGNNPAGIFSNLIEFAIEEPATLVLKNLNLTYNGTYRFGLTPSIGAGSSDVVVFIAVTPTVKVDCTNPSTVNVTDDFTCVCTASGGNPPAEVAWYKENKKIADSELRLINVSKDDAGMYRCEAKSHESAINTTEIELIVNYPPDKVKLTMTRSGKSATIKCSAEAQPPACFKIFLNETKLVSTQNTYTIPDVTISHVGNYSCVAKNILGSKNSSTEYLSLEGGQMQTTTSPTTIKPSPTTIKPSPTTQIIASSTVKGTVPTTTGTPGTTTTEPPSPPVGIIVGSVVGALALILLVVVVVYCYRAKQKDKRNRGNIGPVAGNHYELENEAPDAGGDNAYDTVGPVGASGSKKKAPQQESLPPVYAAVDKNNRQGNTLYASLDTEAMQPKRESKKEPDRTPQTEYASIDFAKSAKDVPKADLV